jgi:hypothetical protein
MKCLSCEMEINPKWKHAIDANMCPFCGESIMEEQLKNLFSLLGDAMEQLSDYPEPLNDWMLSHDYIRTDSEKLISFIPKEYLDKLEEEFLEKHKRHYKDIEHGSKKFSVKVSTDQGEQEVMAERIQSEEKTSEFHKRAEAVKPNLDGFKSVTEKTQHLKAMAQQIKREGASVVNHSGLSGMISAEMMESADPDAVAELQAAINGGDSVSSSLPDSGFDGEDEIPSAVLRMANSAQGNGKSTQADLAKLQQLQSRVSGSRKNFLSGGGGFSRA